MGVVLASCTTKTTDGIAVISREDGSGTRGAFEELIGFDAEDGDDLPAGTTTINSTGAVKTQVAGNKNALGYISLGSLSSDVKALTIGGLEATSANVTSGDYTLATPFMVASAKTVAELSAFETDFYNFLNSTNAQTIIAEDYISVRTGTAYSAAYTTTGRGADAVIAISGSTSVQPLMDELVGAYLTLNTGLSQSDITVSGGGSSTGMTNAIEETSTFGMASRELKTTEIAALEIKLELAKDGIAVIVHPDNKLNDVSTAELKKIYTGEVTVYSALADIA